MGESGYNCPVTKTKKENTPSVAKFIPANMSSRPAAVLSISDALTQLSQHLYELESFSQMGN